jgi:DNA-binding MarR family transcriptional regulator
MAASPASNPHEFDLDQHLFFWLTQVIGSRDRRLAQELKPFGLRVPEWRALAALHARGGCSMTELADLSSIDRTTLTRTIDRMQEARWLSRLADTTDMRVIRLALTKTGERLFAQVWPAVERLNQAAVDGLPAPAVDMLRWTLARMKSNLDLEPAEAERAA